MGGYINEYMNRTNVSTSVNDSQWGYNPFPVILLNTPRNHWFGIKNTYLEPFSEFNIRGMGLFIYICVYIYMYKYRLHIYIYIFWWFKIKEYPIKQHQNTGVQLGIASTLFWTFERLYFGWMSRPSKSSPVEPRASSEDSQLHADPLSGPIFWRIWSGKISQAWSGSNLHTLKPRWLRTFFDTQVINSSTATYQLWVFTTKSWPS